MTIASTRSQVVFTCPLPPKEAAPNGRFHWAARARATAEYRLQVALCVMEACGGACSVPCFERAVIDLLYEFTTNRRHDPDNLTAWGKGCLDGIVDAGLLPDDSLQHVTLGRVGAVKAARPGLRVTVTRATAEEVTG